MNARLYKKFLKKRINRLESDNDLMRRIIADSPKMKELYELYNKPPRSITHTTMQFQEYKAKRTLSYYMTDDEEVVIEHTKQELAKALLEEIKNSINYEIGVEHFMTTVTASVFIGRK